MGTPLRPVWFCLLWACGGDGGQPRSEAAKSGAGAASGAVVARVDGMAVGVQDVQLVSEVSGLLPRDAASRLIEARLLEREAERRGYGSGAGVQRAVRRAAVHELLAREVEGVETLETLPEDIVQAELAKTRKDQTLPERRRVDHVLFLPGEEAPQAQLERARRLAEEAFAELRVGEPDAIFARYRQSPTLDGIGVKVERLPPFARDGSLMRPFEEAMFALSEVGQVAGPVRTGYGFHALVLREILPPRAPDLSELEDQVRRRLLQKRRTERLEALLKSLREQAKPVFEESTMRRAFADPVEAP